MSALRNAGSFGRSVGIQSRDLHIGNEAVGCSKEEADGKLTEEIVSRVRDRSFTLKWTMPKPNTDAEMDNEIRDKIRNVGEQVAGSLF